ncbi:MAG: hemolysin family protein, partial [bacterium]
AFVSGTETAFYSLDRAWWMVKSHQGSRSARRVVNWLEQPVRFLCLVLVANTIANILFSALVVLFLEKGGNLQRGEFFLVTLIGTPLIVLVAGEVLPKTVALLIKDYWASFAGWALRGIEVVLFPLVVMVRESLTLLLRAFGITVDRLSITRQDVISHLGKEPPRERAPMLGIVRRALEVKRKVVGDVMTPRVRVVAMPADTHLSQVRRKFGEIIYQRIILYGKSLDEPLGYIYAPDLLGEDFSVPRTARELMRELPLVPESLSLYELPRRLKDAGSKLAGVLDEFGGLAGVVSLEDLGEELVGSILEEDRRAAMGCLRLSSNVWVVRGDIRLTLLQAALGGGLPPSSARTLNGLLIKASGERLPQPGQEFPLGSWRARIITAHRRGAQWVRMEKVS